MDIIADDLSGAADTGLQFLPICGDGVPIVFDMADERRSPARVVVYNTDTRTMSEHDACGCIRRLCRTLRNSDDSRPRRIFKKVDSTLRGHLRAELVTMMKELGVRVCCVAPAFPEAGDPSPTRRVYPILKWCVAFCRRAHDDGGRAPPGRRPNLPQQGHGGRKQ